MECDDDLENQTTKCPSCGEEIVPTRENLISNAKDSDPFTVPHGNLQCQKAVPKTANRMKEYKVLTQKDKWFSGKFAPELLEQAINSYASQGWRVIAATTASFPGLLSGNREEMIIIMERDK